MTITVTDKNKFIESYLNEFGWDTSLPYEVYDYRHLRDEYKDMDEDMRAFFLTFGADVVEPENELEELAQAARDTLRLHNDYLDEAYRKAVRAEIEAKKCTKCNGTGYLPQYYYWHNGECFKCSGTGQKAMYDLLRSDQ